MACSRRLAGEQLCSTLRVAAVLLLGFTSIVMLPARGAAQQSASQPSSDASDAPTAITLQDALSRARSNVPEFRSAQADVQLAHEDRVQGLSALLPQVTQNTGAAFTGTNGTDTGFFVASNGVNEYISQANVHQTIGLEPIAQYRRLGAAEALTRAKLEIASRGLVVTVTKAYYDLVVAQRKYTTAHQAAAEAERFLQITQNLANGGEVARSDVLKAQIQNEQKQRDMAEAQLAERHAQLGLAVLIFPRLVDNFTVVDDLSSAKALPSLAQLKALAARDNPDLGSALAALSEADHDVTAARSGYLPSLTIDYLYGIDAPRFATRTGGINNLGSGILATVQIPVWNWGATQSKIRQADLHRQQARLDLSFAQKKLLSDLNSFYDEADAASFQLQSLRRSTEFAADSLRLTNMRYQAGEATVLEVVDAQDTLTQARDAYDDGQERYRLGLANLQTLTGEF
jgi:outer membrane protein TolC